MSSLPVDQVLTPEDPPVDVRGDLDSPTQVHHLVVAFYREIVFDEVLEPVFGEIAEVDWAEHIPKLIDFWCWVLLRKPGYRGSLMGAHRHLHSLEPLRLEHCDRWFELWTRCVDERWAGPGAEAAKAHAVKVMSALAAKVIGVTWEPRLEATVSSTPQS